MEEKSHFEVFWQTYPIDLCTRRGSKPKAEKIFNKLDTEMQQKILVQMRELIRADRAMKKTGQFVARWPMVTTWLNGERWNDISDLNPNKHREFEKKHCGCGADAQVGDMCWSCHEKKTGDRYKKELRAELERIGMWKREGEGVHDWQMRCRTYCLERGFKAKGMGALVGGRS